MDIQRRYEIALVDAAHPAYCLRNEFRGKRDWAFDLARDWARLPVDRVGCPFKVLVQDRMAMGRAPHRWWFETVGIHPAESARAAAVAAAPADYPEAVYVAGVQGQIRLFIAPGEYPMTALAKLRHTAARLSLPSNGCALEAGVPIWLLTGDDLPGLRYALRQGWVRDLQRADGYQAAAKAWRHAIMAGQVSFARDADGQILPDEATPDLARRRLVIAPDCAA